MNLLEVEVNSRACVTFNYILTSNTKSRPLTSCIFNMTHEVICARKFTLCRLTWRNCIFAWFTKIAIQSLLTVTHHWFGNWRMISYSPAKWWHHKCSDWFTLLLLCTNATLILCYYWFDHGSSQVKRELVDLVMEDYDVSVCQQIELSNWNCMLTKNFILCKLDAFFKLFTSFWYTLYSVVCILSKKINTCETQHWERRS